MNKTTNEKKLIERVLASRSEEAGKPKGSGCGFRHCRAVETRRLARIVRKLRLEFPGACDLRVR
jgi:hypothetical protein